MTTKQLKPMTWVLKQYLQEKSVIVYLILALSCNVAAVMLHDTTFNSGSIYLICGALAIGWGCYLVQEYIAHVWIFHMKAPKNRTFYRLLYRLHMGHHDDPKRLDILITPLWLSLIHI